MAVTTIQGPGAVDGTITDVQTNDRAGYLIKFSNEVVHSVRELAEISTKINKRTIVDSKGAQWPLLGKAKNDPSVNNRGQDVALTEFNQNTLTLQPDDRTSEGFYIDDQDNNMAHFDFRGHYTDMISDKFALSEDTKVFAKILQGARASARVTGETGGATVINATMNSDASVFEDSIIDGITVLKNNRYRNMNEFDLYTTPEQVALLLKGSKVINKDFSGTAGVDSNMVPSMYGLRIHESINIKEIQTNYVDSVFGGKYSVDGTNTVGLIVHKTRSVVGVQLGTMKIKISENDTGWGNYWLMALQTGYDYLVPDSIVELATA
jgi:hypothetical protein